MSEVLRGEADLDAVIRPTSVDDLWMITAGSSDSRALQMLAHESVRTLFDRLKGRFDFLVVDTSPVLPVPDALLIGQHLDAAVCSILRDVSQVPRVFAAHERLQTLGIRILGAVLAGVRSDVYGVEYQYSRRGPG